ncbi:MAG TPA: cytochrome P450 [Pseudonocardia sp.]|nr:cytochrome P450 [Pseudonocardia sp.]
MSADPAVAGEEIGYNPYLREVQADPYPYFERLRERCPVHRFVIPDADVTRINDNPLISRTTTEFYTLSRYADVESALQHHNLFRSWEGPGPDRASWPDGVGMLQFADEPEHRFQRRIVMQAIHPRIIRLWEPRIAEIADELIDGFAEDGRADISSRYCWALPIAVFCEIFGLGGPARGSLRGWIQAIIGGFGGDAEAVQASFVAFQEAFTFFLNKVTDRRSVIAAGTDVPDDLLTALIQAEVDGVPFRDDQLVSALVTMMLGGNDTTASAMGNCLKLLLESPVHLDQLRRDPGLWPAAVEEMIRFDSPVQALYRTTVGDAQVAGVTIPHDSKVRVMFASANRDGSVFTDPDELDFGRGHAQLRRHLGFGTGVHACVGILLARTDLNVGLRRLFDRLPGLRLDPSREPRRADATAFLLRSWDELPVVWDGAGGHRDPA